MSPHFAMPSAPSLTDRTQASTRSVNVAVDCGHGYTKALSQAGGRIMFPSLICPPPPRVDLGEFGQAALVTIDGQPFLIGEPARRHATPLWSRDKAADPETLRLILVAAAQLGVTGPLQLATGLPLSWFGAQRHALRDALLGYAATVTLPDRPPQRLWIDRVKVLPQAAAGALAALTGPVTRPETWLDLDVGYRTTDYLIVTRYPDRPMEIATELAGSLELGMHAVTQELVRQCESTYGLAFDESELESLDSLTIRGDRVALAPLRTPYQDRLATRIHDELRLRLGAQLDRLDGVLVLGGGGHALYPSLQRLFPQCLLGSEAQWANAHGYLLAL
uniref:StbA-family protein n=1 Tax=Sulfobacillus thermotolerans TaxID=338644 RepID=G5CJ03_9FIRM|nr:ParM/StbA family protein [Sulfobacillus thermotolerans]AEP14280.1 StbA-family protein [Sulfobacillus thermotolerans]